MTWQRAMRNALFLVRHTGRRARVCSVWDGVAGRWSYYAVSIRDNDDGA